MLRMTRALVALVLLIAAFSARASLWYGDDDGLHRVDTNANRTDLSIDTGEPASLAVNSLDASVWVLTGSRIAHYSADGTRLYRAWLDSLANSVGNGHTLALNPADGSVWVAGERRLLHLSANGSLLTVVQIAASDMTVGQDGVLWVLLASDNEVRRYANQGALLSRVNLNGAAREATMMALDDTRHVLWLAGNDELVQLDANSPTHTLRSIDFPDRVRDVALDPQTGDLWVLGQQSFYGYSAAGNRFITSRLSDDGIRSPDVIAFDIATQALWIGHEHGLTRFDRTGHRIASLRTRDEVETVAVSRAPVNILPTVALVSPAANALLTNARPTISFQYGATCSGAPCAFPPSFFSSFSLTAILNGAAVGPQFVFDAATGQTRYVPPTALPQGLNQISAEAHDAFGHTSATVTGQFTIDSVAPAFVGVTPVSGTAFTTSPITIRGSTNDPVARVRLSGVAADQGSTFSFIVPLVVGQNSFTLTAADPPGNATTMSLSYPFSPPNVPPLVSITSPANGANFTAPATIAVTASASDPDGSVTRVDFFNNGAPAGTDSTTPYTTSLANLPTGSYAITAAAIDNRGATTTSATVNVTVGPPNAPPTVTLTKPLNGATFTAPASIDLQATASDTDGTIARVEFLRGGVIVATVTSAPYQFTLAGVAAGSYQFAARAVDNLGATATSTVAAVTVNAAPPNTPPTVALTRPANGATFTAPATIKLEATANDSDGTVARVEFLRAGVIVATVTSAPYEFTLTDVTTGSYQFAARAVDDRGGVTTSATASVSVGALALTLASPTNGETVDPEGVVVSGTFQGPAGASISVNGIAAKLSGSTYLASVPVVEGPNTLTVILAAPAGQTLSRSVNVVAAQNVSPVEMVVQPAVGFAPLPVKFTFTNRTSADLSLTFDGAGPFGLPADSAIQLSLTYPAGVYSPEIVVSGAGATSRRRLLVEVIDAAALDQRLRAMWSAMNSALVAGDLDRAMTFLTPGAQARFGPVFERLRSAFPSIVASYSQPQKLDLSPELGEYAINRTLDGVNRVFLIYFVQMDGAWLIDAM
jgi:Bacterial Ig domain/Glucodextranase, domain B